MGCMCCPRRAERSNWINTHSIELQQATSATNAAASDSEQKRDSARCRILHRQATPAFISLVRICLVGRTLSGWPFALARSDQSCSCVIKDKQANWLRAPKADVRPMMRIYWPKRRAVTHGVGAGAVAYGAAVAAAMVAAPAGRCVQTIDPYSRVYAAATDCLDPLESRNQIKP
jgi:hypothetical protein